MVAFLVALAGVGSLVAPPHCSLRVARHASLLRAPIALCAEAEPPPLLGGTPLLTGDPLLKRDEESDAWWRATVVETSGEKVLVHFSGCDSTWDEWVDVASPDLFRMDSNEQSRGRSAFQSDEFEASLDDEELLEQYRAQRWEDNARWQLTTFAGAQLGDFDGSCVLYRPATRDDGSPKMAEGGTGETSVVGSVLGASKVKLGETGVSADLELDLELGYEAFTPEAGNMAVANAFTLAAPRP